MLEPIFEVLIEDMETLGMLLEHCARVTGIKRHGIRAVPLFDLDFSRRKEAKELCVKEKVLFAFPASYKSNGMDYFKFDKRKNVISYLSEKEELELGLRTSIPV